jgi:hypothetical protein
MISVYRILTQLAAAIGTLATVLLVVGFIGCCQFD